MIAFDEVFKESGADARTTVFADLFLRKAFAKVHRSCSEAVKRNKCGLVQSLLSHCHTPDHPILKFKLDLFLSNFDFTK